MLKPCQMEEKKRNKDEVFKKEDYITYNNLGNNKTYFVKTYGCQMNEHDSENIRAILEDLGFRPSDDIYDSDLVILNTCAIRENAHNKVFGLLGRIKHNKESRDVIVGFCGCMAQEEHVVNLIEKKYKYIDFVFGTHNIHKLPTILKTVMEKNERVIEVYNRPTEILEDIPVKRDSNIKAWVNIMLGCDKFCTYCIVPYTRGTQRSRNKDDIINEIIKLKNEGYKEVTLLGQNVNAYGKDLNIDYKMADLLEDTAKTGIDRIRFVTSHPWDFEDKMIDVISKYPNIMPYIHLPLQSGSDRILKLMGRRYTRKEYITLFNKIKEKVKNVSITTDIIVGFPGETEEDFEETLSLVNECKFDSAFTFIFSPREGTPASKMEDKVTIEEKENRLHRLNELVNKYSLEKNKEYVGKKVKVLIEGKSDKENVLMGYTDTMKLVNAKGNVDAIGTIVDVKILDAKTWSLDGEII
ncbi:(Dimethylallyl)adenosine tRNA methylthiotransferase MiaB [Firmicutes bacterium CAG:884]|nr:tRNA (N6-isopentenyl adenosine(37)-C2)-methylthiotransferase MiaB [Bacillota bacterium]CCY94372.1 (Dimethylallyl)adenosine tRNA methylthiotransferase MiaB [Firmicutes bacterium CAG:884]